MAVREAVVLAGGLGTRLQAAVPDLPKPMAPVAGRPFLEYLLDYLASRGVRRTLLSLGYRHEVIVRHFGHRYRGMQLLYAVEESPLGTGGGLAAALEQCTARRVFVLNGDTFFPVNLSLLELYFTTRRADLVMALHAVADSARYGTLQPDETGRIVRFAEKQEQDGGLINGGVYLVRRSLFRGSGLAGAFSFEKDFLEPFTGRKRFFGVRADAPFLDIGLPESYRLAETVTAAYQQTLSGTKSGRPAGKALFLDRDGTINVEKNYVFRKEDFVFREGIFELVRGYYRRGYRIFVITNQAGIARGMYTEEDFRVLTEWMAGQFREQGIEISAVYHCPHHPRFTGECGCRKPQPGMILEAVRQYGLDPGRCLLIGDKPGDAEAGLRAGIGRNYLVKETGKVTLRNVTVYKS